MPGVNVDGVGHGDHLFLVARMAWHEGAEFNEQLSLFLSAGVVLTFQERTGDPLEPVRGPYSWRMASMGERPAARRAG